MSDTTNNQDMTNIPTLNDNLDAEIDTAIETALMQSVSEAMLKGSTENVNIKKHLKEQLTIMIVHRDHKVLEHGIKIGKGELHGE
ncbi:MAG TPA: hypothetical protein PKD15_00695 [Candidatus Saccharibacteria bacterium]|nr:hypothetical protein [Candidatus Saccharibacteria bacterium]